MELARMLDKALMTSPDFGKTEPHLIAALLEYLETVPADLVKRMLTLPDGIQTRTKFIPSISEFETLRNDLTAKRNQFKPAHTTYHKLEPDKVEVPPLEVRKQQVREALGYDPQERRGKYVPSPEEIAAATAAVDRLNEAIARGEDIPLRTPPKPASKYLKKLMHDQGHGHLIKENAT